MPPGSGSSIRTNQELDVLKEILRQIAEQTRLLQQTIVLLTQIEVNTQL